MRWRRAHRTVDQLSSKSRAALVCVDVQALQLKGRHVINVGKPPTDHSNNCGTDLREDDPTCARGQPLTPSTLSIGDVHPVEVRLRDHPAIRLPPTRGLEVCDRRHVAGVTARTRRPGSLPNGWLTFTC